MTISCGYNKLKSLFCAVSALTLCLIVFNAGCTNYNNAEKLIGKRCSVCHSTSRIFKGHYSDSWEEIVDRMIRHGARLSAPERAEILEYLKNKDD